MNREGYEAYLASPQWEQVRRRIIRRRNGRCEACGSKENLHVHHGTYERFRRELDDDLFLLCELCHDALHRYQRLTRIGLMEATSRFVASASLRGMIPARQQSEPAAPPKNYRARLNTPITVRYGGKKRTVIPSLTRQEVLAKLHTAYMRGEKSAFLRITQMGKTLESAAEANRLENVLRQSKRRAEKKRRNGGKSGLRISDDRNHPVTVTWGEGGKKNDEVP